MKVKEFNEKFGDIYELSSSLKGTRKMILFANNLTNRKSWITSWETEELPELLTKKFDEIEVPEKAIAVATNGRILVYNNHWDCQYFDANSQEKLAAAALTILKIERTEGAFRAPEPPTPLDFTSVESLPESIQKEAVEKLERFKKAQKRYNWDAEIEKNVEKAIKEKDATQAWFAIESLSESGHKPVVEIKHLES